LSQDRSYQGPYACPDLGIPRIARRASCSRTVADGYWEQLSTSPKAAAARQRLAKFGIDINDASNGVFLPRGSASANPTGASVHSRIHTNDYYTYVNDMVGGARNASEARDVLAHIRRQLQGGYWP
ncbi:AHH domain-containing protein, partial [Streptomyces sp. NPDC047706]|uniref:AHH domain-containing protein n=1 Tax=Streptomyces sp. NPDC047706 TaxID=3365486 RepID=UPI0037172E6D